MSIWTPDKPFKLCRNIISGDLRTRTIEAIEFFATETEARQAFRAAHARNERSRSLMVMHFGRPDNYGHADSAECLAIKRFRRA